MVNFASSQQSQTELRLYFGVCILQQFQQSSHRDGGLANIRIIETAAKHLGVSMDKFPVYIDRYGNTSSASIPIAFCDAVAEGRIKRGDKICLVGFGGGLMQPHTLARCLRKKASETLSDL